MHDGKPLYKYANKTVNVIPLNEDYKFIGMWWGETLWALRSSLGDYAIVDGAPYLESYLNYIFWFTFLILVFSSNIVMLNFIVAQASNSYNKINEKLLQTMQAGKSDLISEADSITWRIFKNKEKLPKYLVVR